MAAEGLSNSHFIPTKCSKRIKNAKEDFRSVEFVSYKPKEKTKLLHKANEERHIVQPRSNSDDMKKLRFEVIKFGTTGLDPSKKQASSTAMAVALGAKPPKNKYKNYKEILNEKIKMKESSQVDSKKNLVKEPMNQTKRHLYVVGDKVIPAKPKESKDNIKNFLEGYGRPGKSSIRKGFKKKGRR